MDLAAAFNHLKTKLTDGAFVPSGTKVEPFPYEGDDPAIVYKLLANKNLSAFPRERVLSEPYIEVVYITSWDDVETAIEMANDIETSLVGTGGVNDYGTVHDVIHHKEIFEPFRSKSGKQKVMVGAVYRMYPRGG
ncbi:MAG: hypothetical protein ABL962_18860 [Fimbriimonadaceae bacterium]